MKDFRQVFSKPQAFLTLLVAAVLLSVSACNKGRRAKTNGETTDDVKETTTHGNIRIGIDVTMKPVMQQQVEAFMQSHPKAVIRATYASESDLVKGLLEDSLRMILISRHLKDQEAAVIKKAKIRPTEVMIGRDAVALVVNHDCPMDMLKMDHLGRLMRGEAKTWRDLGVGSDKAVSLVFDEAGSSTVRLMTDLFLGDGKSLPPNAYVATSQERVIDHVEKDPNSIGFIGYCLVSDRDDSTASSNLSRVKLVGLDAPDSTDIPGVYVRPYQNEITLGRYPLSRPIYAVSREHFVGLGTGFVVFVAGELGQRIFLKAGLVPEFMPPRLVVLPEKVQ